MIELNPIYIKEDYRVKWNIRSSDFFGLAKDGELISDSLYRKGGMWSEHNIKNDYFMILKYVEAYYKNDIVTDQKSKPHLEGRWCIIDKNGIEKVEFKAYSSPYMVNNSQIYSLDSNYYNIETGEYYGYSSTSIKSADFLFLDTFFSKDESKRGVMKINKKNGTWELFK